jgi:predicted nuclease of predicted toxin-antitoxin system
MRLLIDAIISWRLAPLLSQYCEVITHVNQTELQKPAKDSEIWQYALDHDYHILTLDEDFRTLVLVKGFPPKVVLMRGKNLLTSQLGQFIISQMSLIETFVRHPEEGLLEIYHDMR